MSFVQVQELEDLAEQMKLLREEIDEDKKALSEKTQLLDEIEAKFVAHLKELGKTSYKSEHGTVTRVEKWRVNLPATPEDKQKFLEYIKSKGLESMLTVNSNSLNSYYMTEWEQAKNSGDPEDALNFSIPGISEPKVHEIISFRRK